MTATDACYVAVLNELIYPAARLSGTIWCRHDLVCMTGGGQNYAKIICLVMTRNNAMKKFRYLRLNYSSC